MTVIFFFFFKRLPFPLLSRPKGCRCRIEQRQLSCHVQLKPLTCRKESYHRAFQQRRARGATPLPLTKRTNASCMHVRSD